MKFQKKLLRRLGGLLLAAATVWALSVTMHSSNAQSAFSSLRREGHSTAVTLLRWELGDFAQGQELSAATLLALQESPMIFSARDKVLAAQTAQPSAPLPSREEEQEGTLIQPEQHSDPPQSASEFADNGVPARTLLPGSEGGYVVHNGVYINNLSHCSLSAADLESSHIPALADQGPQILIVHTHGSEAYTMPLGQEYEASGDHRCLDAKYNMIRIGDEIAEVLAEHGLSVLHDRELYDYPSYSGAYDRSYEAIQAQLKKYPGISCVLDIHRDAIADSSGKNYKVIANTQRGQAAQLEFVMGSSGGGRAYPNWLQNLQLAAAVQAKLQEECAELMRPIVLRDGRYNQQLTTGSLLLEVGAAGNSQEEALLSARLFAEAFAAVLGKSA